MVLGQLEAAVMDRLWSWDRSASVRDVLEDLTKERPLAYTTVMTVMDNLHRKGLLLREKRGRAFVYRAASSRERHTAELMERAMEGIGDRGGVLLRFVEQLSEADLASLRAVVADIDPESDAGRAEGAT
ncbi:Transcriptional regulator BlaI [Nocardioides dokdonensis FR1436]|uniref:Transcriptional regulator BlaI n=1 Tax=Nocardioides dokdonensis FR1436 TaxID=1300347 RepID=A0A1A9GS15_9ACTN|nr:BlaI/MecI/CopY family transcriptional regulator [Nocardioides dokdonensis]ANH40443.1 Transcriptional regulator BlaI [Nocardioides dokdonensis FR1436]